jgi:outer membrane lipoprotein SlyB
MSRKLFLILAVPALLVSCAQDTLTGDTVSRNQARMMETVETGRIVAIDPVKIEGGNQTGALMGAVAGGFLGSNIGSGRAANTAGAVGGALAGSAIGSHVEQGMTSRQGIRITVRLDSNKRTVSTVQQVSPREQFQVGDRVRYIVAADGTARVAF